MVVEPILVRVGSSKNFETYMKDKLGERWKIPKIAVNTFPIEYEPTEDVTLKLEPELASYYQSNIFVL